MKTTRFSGPVCVALAMFALPAAAQTPDGMTPAEETICDPLADATPGLYGLCVAMCEAQDCRATRDPNTGAVEFSERCNPSAERILANYNQILAKNNRTGPPMPCVQDACACWSIRDIENIGGTSDSCVDRSYVTGLFGHSADGTELAYAYPNSCVSIEMTPDYSRTDSTVDAVGYATCRKSVIDECEARGVPIR